MSCSALPYFRILATEFHEKADDEVCIWVEMTEPMVDSAFFGKMYLQALALLTAHRMKMAQLSQDMADGIQPIQSIAEDGGSVTYALNQSDIDSKEGSLKSTKYGQSFLEIRKTRIVGMII